MSEPSPPPGMVRPPLPAAAAAALLAAALLHCAPAAPARRHKPVSRDHPVTLSPVIPPILSPPPTPPPEALRYSSEGSIAPTSRSRDAGTGSSDALPGVTGRGTMSRRCGPPPNPGTPSSSWHVRKVFPSVLPSAEPARENQGAGRGGFTRGHGIPPSFKGSRALAAC